MSALAVGYIFQAMLKPEGAVNGILGFLLGQPVEIAWLGSTTWTIVVVALIHAWKWMGLSMLIYLAGLKTINRGHPRGRPPRRRRLVDDLPARSGSRCSHRR